VPPAVALGRRLTDAGRDVRLMGSASIEGASRAAGVRFVSFRSVEPWPQGLVLDDDWDRLSELLDGRGVIDDLLRELRTEPADVLVVDCMMGAGFAVGEYLGLPMVMLAHVLYQAFAEDWGGEVLVTAQARASLGLPPVQGDPFGAALDRTGRVLALVPPGFDVPLRTLPANTSYVGPILLPDPVAHAWDFPWPIGEPTVLISLSSTLQHQGDALPTILNALADLPVHGVLTLGGMLPADAIHAPSNVIVRDYVPHASVLPHTSAVLCHGSLSTVTTTLAHGVSLVCIPQGREQPLNAARVDACGAGLSVPSDAPASAIAEALRTVLQDPPYRAGAAEMARRTAALGAGAEATRLVEALLPTR
jgi:MGT family glycosyltransferase